MPVCQDETPGAHRPIHRAGLSLLESDGKEIWVDVRVTATKPDKPIEHALCQAKMAKCQQYGQGPPHPSILHGCMVPFVAQTRGRLAPIADALASYLITRQAQVIEQRQEFSPSVALRQASTQFWETLSCHLSAGWLGLAHCPPLAGRTAAPSELAASQMRRPPFDAT